MKIKEVEFVLEELSILIEMFLPINYKFAIKLIDKGLNLLKYVGKTVSSLTFKSKIHQKYYLEVTEKEYFNIFEYSILVSNLQLIKECEKKYEMTESCLTAAIYSQNFQKF